MFGSPSLNLIEWIEFREGEDLSCTSACLWERAVVNLGILSDLYFCGSKAKPICAPGGCLSGS